MDDYQPGVCNINQDGVEYRQKIAYVAGVVGALLLFTPVYFGVGGLFGSVLGVFVMYVGVLNYLQARNSFCVNHGTSGTQQAKAGTTQAEEVTDDISLEKDKARSKSIIKQAIWVTLLISVLILAVALTIIAFTAEIAFEATVY